MRTLFILLALLASTAFSDIGGTGRPLGTFRTSPYSHHSLHNPYGAGNPYRSNGLMNPYSPYGNRYSNRSWTNPYARNAPKLYEGGQYRGRFSSNRYDSDSISNRYGKYGNPYRSESLNNPYGAGNPYRSTPIYVYPGKKTR